MRLPEILTRPVEPDELRAFREEWNLTQTELAECLGSRAQPAHRHKAVLKWESGKGQPLGLRLALQALAVHLQREAGNDKA